MSQPEPWLRGTLTGIAPELAPILYSFQQAIEDLEKWTEGLTDEEMWARPMGLAPVGFQVQHIAGSIDRLLTYASGAQLSEEQMSFLKAEMNPGAGREELLEGLREQIASAESFVRSIEVAHLNEARSVGRKQLPTTVIGLLVHTAEHTQRHVGQAIVTAKVVKAGAPS